ncbi:MAG: gamma-glutamyltransferase family protein [Acetobacteraceae bacterium]|nr:gamma-glutamyltransferase family protein [Acetobacteraceae bacterium]
MIVAPQPEAVEAGAQVLEAGGNAMDATLACALTQGVVDPLMCGIGGLGVMHVWDRGTGRHEIMDGLSTAPQAATPDMWARDFAGECADGYGYMVGGAANELGHKAVTTPGILRVFEAAHRDYGHLPWADLFAPAITRAREGWAIRPHVYSMFTMDERAYGRRPYIDKLTYTAEGAALYAEDGAPKRLGRPVRNPALAATLEMIATGGVDEFYAGGIAHRIADDMAAREGLMTLADLAGFRPRRHAPILVPYRGRTVALPPPPAGGIVVAEIMRILERFDLVALGHNSPEYIRVAAEAMKIAGQDKEEHIGDPDFMPAPLDRLLSDEYADACAGRIRAGQKASLSRVRADSKETTTISCWDENGLVVSLTHTLGTPSGVIPPGTGFMLNGAMNWYDPRPGRPGSIAPGKRRFSSMTPSLVLADGQAVVSLGAPGGAWIGVAVAQGLINVLDWGMGMQAAVSAPRFSATTDAIDISNRIPYRTQAAVEAMGYEVKRSPLSYAFAGLHGIAGWDGVLDGGADPQRDGYAASIR